MVQSVVRIMMDNSFFSDFLYTRTLKVSRWQRIKNTAILNSQFSLLAPPAVMLLPQQNTAMPTALTTTEWEKISIILLHISKDLSSNRACASNSLVYSIGLQVQPIVHLDAISTSCSRTDTCCVAALFYMMSITTFLVLVISHPETDYFAQANLKQIIS